ncbi:MAG: hypothetical protein PHF80_03405, partial [Methanothrix sp.]|nr:hypothetical protein [Methanothrix sp.]
MKYVQFLVALLAASIFVIPATSMQGNGNAGDDCKAQIEQPSGLQQCDCPNALAAFGIMNQGKESAPCGQMSQQGPNDNNAGPKSMMDGKQPAPCGQMSQQGPNDNNAGPKSMMDGKQPAPCGQKS